MCTSGCIHDSVYLELVHLFIGEYFGKYFFSCKSSFWQLNFSETQVFESMRTTKKHIEKYGKG